MTREQVMYWGKNEWEGDDDDPFWKRFLGFLGWYTWDRLFHPGEGTIMRLTPDGDDLEAYFNDKGFLCVIDPDTNEEVIAVWG